MQKQLQASYQRSLRPLKLLRNACANTAQQWAGASVLREKLEEPALYGGKVIPKGKRQACCFKARGMPREGRRRTKWG